MAQIRFSPEDSTDDILEEFIELFNKVKDMGFIESHRQHNTGIGKTLEDICNIPENNLSSPDFKNIEIKSQRDYTTSSISLVTKSPDFPAKANNNLRERYGYADTNFPDVKCLRIRVGPEYNNVKNKWGFRLKVDRDNERIVFIIKNLEDDKIEDFNFGYYTSTIKKIIDKLNRIAYVTAKKKDIDGKEYFHFSKFVLVTGITYEKVLDLLEKGIIIVEPRLGVYNSGKLKGKKHDHGTAFRINKKDFINEFNVLEI